MHLDLATILLQWAAGGLAFLWITTRGRVVSLGYGWLLRGVYAALAAGALAAQLGSDQHGTGDVLFRLGAAGLVIGATISLGVSVVRRSVGAGAGNAIRVAAVDRVAAMTGRPVADSTPAAVVSSREFPPALDLMAPIAGAVGLLGAASFSGGSVWLATIRLLVGAAFLGAVTDAMLLGHWYLTQPGLPREPIKELVRWSAFLLPVEAMAMLVPPGMMGVITGTRSDGYDGLLGWMWIVCVITTAILLWVTWLALRERFYSAVMAATGLLYLAILTAAGTDLVARALLAPG